MKKALKIIGILLLALVLAVGGYVAYGLIAYHRLPDTDEQVALAGDAARTGRTYAIATWNMGFGAYSDDFGFFMDGGTESRAFSKDAVYRNLGHATEVLRGLAPDLMILQEVDIGSTRSYQVDEAALVKEALEGYNAFFAQNYDSPYLFYPITRPHGASRSGLLTLAGTAIDRAARIALPVESGFAKFLDLDRCYCKCWIPVEDGRYLVLYNLHLSAYTSDGVLAQTQLELLVADMLSEYEAGNCVVGGGDFNKNLIGDAASVFGGDGSQYTWHQSIPEGTIPEGLTLVNSLDEANPIPSCRIADGPYVKGETFVCTLDGFIVSDNVRVLSCEVIDEGFRCSDHNPIVMQFELTEE